MMDPKQGGPPPPPPVAVGRALLKGVRPGDRVCAVSGLAVYQGRRKQDYLAIIALEGKRPEHRERFGRVAKFGTYCGLKIEHVDESLVLASPLPSGTLADLPALRWRLTRRLETFEAVARLVHQLHGVGQPVGPLPPEHIFLDDGLKPFFLGPGLAEPRDMKGLFAAPETGKEGRVDVASDVFVLGRLLHFVLLQKEPPGENAALPRLDDLAQLPAGLARIVRRCTSTDRTRRYPTVGALLEDFAHYADYDIVGLPHPEGREFNIGKESRPPARNTANVTVPKLSQTNPRVRIDSPSPGAPGGVSTSTSPGLRMPRAKTPVPKLASRGVLGMDGAARIAAAVVGIACAAAALAITYWSGYHIIALIILVAGGASFGLSLCPSDIRGETPIRVVLALAFAVPLVSVWNPLPELGIKGSSERLLSPDANVRARAFRQLVRAGEKIFIGIDLTGAQLTGIRFVGCDLTRVSFRNAALDEGLFHSSKLNGTDFNGARIRGVVFEATEVKAALSFGRAVCDETTRLPSGWTCVEGAPVPLDAAPPPGGAAGPAPEGVAPVPAGEPAAAPGVAPAAAPGVAPAPEAAPPAVAPGSAAAAPDPTVPVR